METINYLCGGALGDTIFLLYVIKQKYEMENRKGNLYIEPKNFTRDINQTYKDIYDFVKFQEYIDVFEIYDGIQIIDVDLNIWRYAQANKNFIQILSNTYKIPYSLNQWCSYKYNDYFKDKIIIHRGERRKSDKFPWESIVTKNKCIFLTCERHLYDDFPYKNLVELYITDSLNEVITILNSCKFVISNQTAIQAITLALNKPCLIELFAAEYQMMDMQENKNISMISVHHDIINESLYENDIKL